MRGRMDQFGGDRGSLATEHPAVMQAAAVGVPDENWR